MEADHRLRADLMAKLLEGNPFEVPQSMVDHQTNGGSRVSCAT